MLVTDLFYLVSVEARAKVLRRIATLFPDP